MKTLRQQMLEEMQLHGLSSGTQECYISAVRRLAAHDQKPDPENCHHQHVERDQ